MSTLAGLVAEAFLVVDAEGRVRAANGAAEALLGQLVGTELAGAALDGPGLRRLLAEAGASRAAVTLRGPDGALHTLDAAVSRVGEPGGELLGVLLRPAPGLGPPAESPELLLAMLELAPDQVAVLDRAGMVLALSRTKEGAPTSQVVGRSVYGFLEPEGRSALENALARAESGRGLVSFEVSARSLGGARGTYTARLKAVRVQGRDCFVLVTTDVTEQVEAEARKRALLLAMDHALDGLARLDAQRTVSWVNAVCARLLGRPAGDLQGVAWVELFTPPTQAALVEALGRIGEAGRVDLEAEVTRADGSFAPCGLTLVVARGASGVPDGAFCFVRDLTAQHAERAQAVVSDRLASVGMLAASVAHEINNPLAAVLGNLQVARRDVAQLSGRLGKPELVALLEMLEDSHEAAERVRDIARDLRTFGHTGDEPAAPVPLWPVIEAALRLARNEVQHRARLVTRHAEVPPVLGSAGRLGQVFLNLVVNAAQAIPEGAAGKNEVRVELEPGAPGEVRVTVSDTGAGMSAQTQRRLFQPFFTTRPGAGGTGLGLSIAQRIVAEHGGRLEVRSAPGAGTTMTVVLPTTEAPAQPSAAPALPAPGHSPPVAPAGARVLLVDDDPLVLRGLSRVLRSQFEVTCAEDGSAALALLQQGQAFDAVLCDVMMPQMTGVEFYVAMQQRHAPLAARLVFLTGGVLADQTRHALERLPCRVLAKPLEPDQLLGLVRELVQRS